MRNITLAASLAALFSAGYAVAAPHTATKSVAVEAVSNHPVVAKLEKYKLDLPEQFYLPYDGRFSAGFWPGLPVAPGSGLTLAPGKAPKGTVRLLGLTDRGPNADAPKFKQGDQTSSTKVFPLPNFTPSLAMLEIKRGKSVELKSLTPLKAEGKAISGRPISPGKTGSTKEVGLDENFQPLPYDDNGLDPEGIALDGKGKGWIADEYGPFLAQVDVKTGAIGKKLAPGAGLPAILGERQPNRGFEALAITPSGKLVAAVQSTLDVNKETRHVAQFIRLVEHDPVTGVSRMFAYPHTMSHYSKSGDAKLGDLVALDNQRFLLIEQGKTKDKKIINEVYLIDISKATDLTNQQLADGRALEYAKSWDELKTITPVAKKRLFDLREFGWNTEKAEGMALIDAKTVAFINDTDFGLTGEMSGEKEKDASDYTYDAATKQLTNKKGEPSKGDYVVKGNEFHERNTHVWLVEFNAPVKSLTVQP
jgi:hypothetical protein